MIRCPHCQVENASGASLCSACGQAIAPARAGSELPQWLRQLKPDAQQAAKPAGTDTLVATRPAPAVSAATSPPTPKKRAAKQDRRETTPRETTPMTNADKAPPASSTNETAALIGEDDLPAWLRAFSDAEAKDKSAAADDQSWMVGSEADAAAANSIAEDLAQSWQARTPARPSSTPRPAASSVFGKTTEVATRPEQVIAAQRPAASATAGAVPVAATSPARPAAGKPMRLPTSSERPDGMNLQRIALIAFAVALVIFLVVVAVFIVMPALQG